MNLLLTDILTCPVCGPQYGLIVRTDTMRERRILEGALGCPNCRRPFPVHGGVALLDPAADAAVEGDASLTIDAPDPDAALRIAALLGLNERDGFALIAGPAAGLALEVAALTDRVEIVADANHARGGDGGGKISRMTLGTVLPVHDGRLNGIWLSGASADVLLEEAGRALHPLGRLVLDPAPADAATRLTSAGLSIKATQDGTILASRILTGMG